MCHFIRVEAVNIYNAIADTDNISVIRGGSLLLKQAIDDISNKFDDNNKSNNKLQPISTGASVGVFKVISGADLKNDIINYLNKEREYQYFTFVVEECEGVGFSDAKEILIAKCRLTQLKQLSVSPDYQQEKGASPCELEGIRPYFREVKDWPGDTPTKKKLSEFVDIKWKYGKEQRSKLYVDELTALAGHIKKEPIETELKEKELTEIEGLKKLTYTSDFEALSGSNQFKNLDGKVAFIYFDGNSFSAIQNELVKSDQDQKQFDEAIKTLRRQFLKQLLKNTQRDRFWGSVKNDKKNQSENSKWLIRLETLLWGGDEMLFVVPAWKGFELLKLFYQCSKDWVITVGKKTSKPLTHAGGIVFCHHKTPIYKVRNLAQSLADDIKETDNGRTANYFNYLVLESIDYPAERLSEFFRKKYHDLGQYRAYLSPDTFMQMDSPMINAIKDTLPKSQIYAISLAACQIKIKANDKDNKLVIENYTNYQEQIQRLIEVSASKSKTEKSIATVYSLFKVQMPIYVLLNSGKKQLDNQQLIQQAIAWLHLVELWDYYMTIMTEQGAEG